MKKDLVVKKELMGGLIYWGSLSSHQGYMRRLMPSTLLRHTKLKGRTW